jgi:two-component system NtrC family sensor kinase
MQILVAEDSTMMRHLLVASLRSWQYEVIEAKNGAEAWELFRQHRAPLVLTDWIMPEMDGIELIRQIRSSDLPGYVYIILLTAKSETKALVEAMDAGADDYLAKPFDQDELRVRIREGERIIRLERTLAEQNRQLRETQAALVQSEKLASLGQLAAGMAHEVNNPVAYVSNNLAVLERDVSSILELLSKYQTGRDVLEKVKPDLFAELSKLECDCDLEWIQDNLPRLFQSSTQGLGRVRDIVKNLREFARLDEAELDELDLNAALQSTIEVLNHDLEEKQLTVEKCFQPVPPILCRPAKIHQVFHNLLLNALQSSQPATTITVRTKQARDSVLVEVEDQGCGIPEGHLSRIFEPFFTTKPIGRGQGLGLAISYGIVRDQGGSISVDSKVGEGSIFRVDLPLRPPQTKMAN